MYKVNVNYGCSVAKSLQMLLQYLAFDDLLYDFGAGPLQQCLP